MEIKLKKLVQKSLLRPGRKLIGSGAMNSSSQPSMTEHKPAGFITRVATLLTSLFADKPTAQSNLHSSLIDLRTLCATSTDGPKSRRVPVRSTNKCPGPAVSARGDRHSACRRRNCSARSYSEGIGSTILRSGHFRMAISAAIPAAHHIELLPAKHQEARFLNHLREPPQDTLKASAQYPGNSHIEIDYIYMKNCSFHCTNT